jgi:hypothetical protein
MFTELSAWGAAIVVGRDIMNRKMAILERKLVATSSKLGFLGWGSSQSS